jgi:hypothetical protein
MSDYTGWRLIYEQGVIRSSVHGTVPALACVAGDRGVRSPGEAEAALVPSRGCGRGEGRTGERE